MLYRRSIEPTLKRHLDRGKSILLLGPRQTGKTTLLGGMAPDLGLSLVAPAVRQRYEKDPSLLAGEVRALPPPVSGRRRPLVTIDEVQKVPILMGVAQDLIDRGEAQFVFTGSSARKLRRGRDLNLLPGRLVALRLDPLTVEEHRPGSLQEALLFGSLPAIRRLRDREDREADLRSYVEI
jgi:predicted AAA+ superfamily ATPase